jgi:molecular chaperone DnaJ
MFNDIFGGAFGGRGGGRRGGVPRGYDLETEVEITLEEVSQGASRDVEFKRLDVCQTCEGSGGKPGTEPLSCPTCGGAGQVQQAGFGGMFRMVTACPHCRGRGKIVTDKCPDCRGKGRISVKRRLSVKIPPGIHDGQAVRITAEGEPPGPELSAGGQGIRGDLHVVVRVQEHKRFQREGNHLVFPLSVAFTQAALGARIEVPTLHASTTLDLPAGTQHGDLFRIDGHGLPDLRSGKRGDLVAVVQLVVPRKLNDAQKRLLAEYSKTEKLDVRPDSNQSLWGRLKDKVKKG